MDGITCVVKKGLEKTITGIAQMFSQNISPYLVIESEIFTKMVVKDVNNFLNITESGKVKKKGLFVTKKPLGDSIDFMVIAKALEAYYVNGINPEDFIRKHTNIHDFCASKKCAKKYSVYWNGDKQQRLNRFYSSVKGAYLYKSEDGLNLHHMMKETGVQLLNNIPSANYLPEDINYQWYIKKTMEVIRDLEPEQLKLF